ncbi:MAG: FemAB family XrtA/PEP-CTERM system-associated protein [Gemmataceae bacterium]
MPAVAAVAPGTLHVRRLRGAALTQRLPALGEFLQRRAATPLSQDPRWLTILQNGLGHDVYALEVVEGDRTRGFLPLAYVTSFLFGRYLVSLPYLNTNGVMADGDHAARLLIDEAVRLADDLRVRHLELRHESAADHPALQAKMTSKVHMRLALPDFPGPLWEGLKASVRNQVRKGEKSGLTAHWGGRELLPEFYGIFCRNMRDLGTPVYGKSLFDQTLRTFPGDAELCVVRHEGRAVASALLLHGRGVTEVPSASCLREANPLCANMMMYWQLIARAIQRGQQVFDFGRCNADGGTFRFKKQWGAEPEPAVWQYYLREGRTADMRPENPRFQRMIRIWQRLPVLVTRLIGPSIVRCIPRPALPPAPWLLSPRMRCPTTG